MTWQNEFDSFIHKLLEQDETELSGNAYDAIEHKIQSLLDQQRADLEKEVEVLQKTNIFDNTEWIKKNDVINLIRSKE